MLEVQEEHIDKITEVFYRILRGEKPHFVELPEDYPDNEIKQVTTYINRFIAEYNKLADFMYSLAKGELDYEAPKGKMTVLQSFKSLQASLRHLAWKTQQIANGNFNHRVDFMGDFSTAFNRMTQQLKEAFEKIEKQNEELEQHRKWLEVILSSIGDGVIATDTSGIITFMNPVAERLTGWKFQDALGQPLMEVLHLVNEKTRQTADISVERVLQAGVAVSLAHHSILISREGQDIPVESRGAPIRGQDGAIHGVILVFHDIRDRRKAEEEQKTLEHQLRQSQKMEALGTLAGGIAHDFNNILGTILGYTEIVFHKQPEGSAEKEFLDTVLVAGGRAADLVQQILLFSRPEENEFKPLLISPLIKETLKMMRSMLPTTIEIQQHIDPKCPPIMANATQIHQLLVNLCTNASHAIDECFGIIEVTLKQIEYSADRKAIPGLKERPYLELSVRDTGCGMTSEVKERIFDPFFTTKQIGEGTGLGLSVVYGIVKAHQGTITVDSEPGKGTTFSIFFPITDTVRSQSDKEKEVSVHTGQEHILIIDDEPILTDLYKHTLEKFGYQVTTFNDSCEALERFRNHPDQFDVVFTDQTMPRMTGVQLSLELLKIRSDLPIILATGYSSAISKEKAKSLGIREFVMKPIKAKKLIHLIRELLK